MNKFYCFISLFLLFCIPSIVRGQNTAHVIEVITVGEEIDATDLRFIEIDFQNEFSEGTKGNYTVRIGKKSDLFKYKNDELRFQHSGAVPENLIKEYGKNSAADQLCVINVTKRNAGDFAFTVQVYEVETGNYIKGATYPDASKDDAKIFDASDSRAIQKASRLLIDRLGLFNTNWGAVLSGLDNQFNKHLKECNQKALVASLVPGIGLMQKGYKGEGSLYLIGDITLIGGGVGGLLYANNQKEIMNSRTSDYTAYSTAEKNYNAAKTTSYVCFGAAVVLYGVNLIRSYVAEPRPGSKLHNLYIKPYAFTPINNPFGNSYDLGMGLALTYNF